MDAISIGSSSEEDPDNRDLGDLLGDALPSALAEGPPVGLGQAENALDALDLWQMNCQKAHERTWIWTCWTFSVGGHSHLGHGNLCTMKSDLRS